MIMRIIRKHRRRLWLPLIVWAAACPSYGQKVLSVEDRMLKDSIGENATRNGKQVGFLTVIRRMTKNTKDNVEATQRLQHDYQDFLKQTGSTASLIMSDAEAEQQAVGQTVGTSTYLSAYSFAADLSKVYQEPNEPMEKSQLLYERLIPYDELLTFTELSSFDAYQRARQLNVTALEEMSQRRKLQLAKTYQQFAQQKIAKAAELRTLLASDQQLPSRSPWMTEAERRLETLRRMQDYLLGSQQLKTKADALTQQTGHSSFQKKQALDAFRKAQERQVLAGTLLFQD